MRAWQRNPNPGKKSGSARRRAGAGAKGRRAAGLLDRFADDYFHHATTPLVLLDRDFNFIRVNEAYARVCQKDVDEFAGHNHFEFYPSDARAIFEDVVRTRQPSRVTAHPFVFPGHPDRGVTYWDWTLTPLPDDRGEVEALVFSLEDVTGRKRAEMALEENLVLLEAITSNTPDHVYVKDKASRFIFANPAVLNFFGISREALTGSPPLEIMDDAAMAAALVENDRRVMESDQTMVFEERLQTVHGQRTFLSTKTPRRNDKGAVVGLIGISIDITELKRAEQALKFERSQLLSIFDGIDEAIYVADPRTYEILYANRVIRDRFGKELVGSTCYEALQGKNAPCEFCTNPLILKSGGERYKWEFHNPIANRDLIVYDRIIRWPDGRDARFELAVDITERTRAEEALRESEEKFRALAESTRAGIILARGDKFIYLNPQAIEELGYTQDELLAMHFWDVIHPESRELVRSRGLGRLQGLPVPSTYEARVTTKNGETPWMEISSTVIDYMGKPAILATIFNITERKRAEEALIKDRYILTKSQEVAHVGNWAWNLETGELTGSAENDRIFGYPPGKVEPTIRWLLSRVLPEDHAMLSGFVEARARDGNRGSIDYRIRRPDGSVGYVNTIVDKSVRDRSGRIKWLYGISQDVTERKRAGEEIKVAKEQAELYLDLMSHDISNMHQIILGNLELAQGILEADGRGESMEREMVDVSLTTLKRSVKLIENIRNIQKLRLGEYRLEKTDLGEVLGETVKSFARMRGLDITIRYEPVQNCYVPATAFVNDIFNNLMDNAVKHCADPVRIDVSVSPVDIDGGHYYRVVVEDNGPGIPDDRKSSSFSRFKRDGTKSMGTGLGLYIVKMLVEGYNGKVWVEDRVKGDHTQGARFVVMLPAAG